MGFIGSEDYIRLQFEEYILSMVSAVKYHLFLEKHSGTEMTAFLPDIDGDPSQDFNSEFVDYWKKTENFRIFQKFTGMGRTEKWIETRADVGRLGDI
jgi:hypothetical protein